VLAKKSSLGVYALFTLISMSSYAANSIFEMRAGLRSEAQNATKVEVQFDADLLSHHAPTFNRDTKEYTLKIRRDSSECEFISKVQFTNEKKLYSLGGFVFSESRPTTMRTPLYFRLHFNAEVESHDLQLKCFSEKTASFQVGILHDLTAGTINAIGPFEDEGSIFVVPTENTKVHIAAPIKLASVREGSMLRYHVFRLNAASREECSVRVSDHSFLSAPLEQLTPSDYLATPRNWSVFSYAGDLVINNSVNLKSEFSYFEINCTSRVPNENFGKTVQRMSAGVIAAD
jgi:hypothetical protein